VFEMDFADPTARANTLEMLACALDLIDDGDPAVEDDEADTPYVLE
jgi:hypothetical protein